jgi:hypothetical protein
MSVECKTYLHFKGGKYRVLFEGFHADNKEPVVIYVSMIYGTVWVRNLSEWNEEVEWPDGTMKPRFIRQDFNEKGLVSVSEVAEFRGTVCSGVGLLDAFLDDADS